MIKESVGFQATESLITVAEGGVDAMIMGLGSGGGQFPVTYER